MKYLKNLIYKINIYNMDKESIINSLITKTDVDYITWSYIGDSDDKYIFIYFLNIYSNKYIIFEMNIFKNSNKNILNIYFQNSKTLDKSNIKEIKNDIKLGILCKRIIDNVYYYDVDFKSVYEILNKIYGKF